jgi:SAM-dependent methyltransferase
MGDVPDLDTLHAPYTGLLRAALALASPAGARLAIDIGCGPGLKAGWLASCLAPGGLILGVDIDRAAVAAAAGGAAPGGWLTGDAHVLPVRPGCADLCWCVAALDQLADPPLALAEARRALTPGGALVVASAAQLWARPRPWPAALYAAWVGAAPPPADGLGDDLIASLAAAGLGAIELRAYLLDHGEPRRAALPLASWGDLVPSLFGRLTSEELAVCAAAEGLAEPEPVAVLLVAVGRAPAPPTR